MSLSDTLAKLADHAASPPKALPGSCYIDPEFWREEVERVLRPGWHAVGRSEQLPNAGDFRWIDLLGEAILLVRNADAKLRAYSRVCLHRASVIVEGEGNTRRFTCPYHRWGYDLEGKLCAAPLMEDVEGWDRTGKHLPKISLEEWQGFVFVNLSPDPAPLTPQLSEFAKALEPIDLANFREVAVAEYDCPWNWKVLIENFMESYHHLGPHVNSLQGSLPAAGTYAMDLEGAGALLDNPAVEGEAGAWVGIAFPAFLYFASRSTDFPFAVWYEFNFDSVDRFDLRIHVLLHSEHADNPQLIEASLAGVQAIHSEDIGVCNGVQRGLESRLFRSVGLSKQEECLVAFHRHLAEKMLGTQVTAGTDQEKSLSP
jgi:phenylpropionate dioxygenase-like ring-hydroxylating dioxygenase large terminal subunit